MDLSLSGWRDEKAVVRWRTQMRHHMVQEKGRAEILLDYHLRVGQVTRDTQAARRATRCSEQRLDETEVGAGTTVTLIDAQRGRRNRSKRQMPADVAALAGPRAAVRTGWSPGMCSTRC